jgi:hypothetical protein
MPDGGLPARPPFASAEQLRQDLGADLLAIEAAYREAVRGAAILGRPMRACSASTTSNGYDVLGGWAADMSPQSALDLDTEWRRRRGPVERLGS